MCTKESFQVNTRVSRYTTEAHTTCKNFGDTTGVSEDLNGSFGGVR